MGEGLNILAWCFGGALLLVGTYAFILWIAREAARPRGRVPMSMCGDFIHLPGEAKAAGGKTFATGGGSSTERTARLRTTGTSLTHSEGAST